MPSTLQQSDYDDYLILLYFGRGEDKLSLCSKRAYGDFQRTLRKIGDELQFPRAKEARSRANTVLTQSFASARDMIAPTQASFDDWHRRVCEKLISIYSECNYPFHAGHAQKWVNMTFKYIYLMGEKRLPGFGHLYDLCHVPIDNVLMKELKSYGFPRLNCVWSKLDYDNYLDLQQWVRNTFKPQAPLDVEFRLWMRLPLPR